MVLEPAGEERILTAAETLEWLASQLKSMEKVPEDLAALATPTCQAQRLLETACELELAPGLSVQWFAVRLEPPGTVQTG